MKLHLQFWWNKTAFKNRAVRLTIAARCFRDLCTHGDVSTSLLATYVSSYLTSSCEWSHWTSIFNTRTFLWFFMCYERNQWLFSLIVLEFFINSSHRLHSYQFMYYSPVQGSILDYLLSISASCSFYFVWYYSVCLTRNCSGVLFIFIYFSIIVVLPIALYLLFF